jgi:hypothetical protein
MLQKRRALRFCSIYGALRALSTPKDAPRSERSSTLEELEARAEGSLLSKGQARGTDPHEIVEIKRLKIREYIVRFGDDSQVLVHDSILEDQGWRRCRERGGHGRLPPKDK